MTDAGAWWFYRALLLQSGKNQLSFEDLEWLTMTLFAILDSSDALARVVLPMPIMAINKQNLYRVSPAQVRLPIASALNFQI